MRSVISLILVYCLAITSVFAQSVNPNDTLKIGKASSSSDKGLTFDTNDGVSNKKLLIEKISKKLKFDGNTFQIGDGSSSSDKELIIAGALKSLKYNGTSGEFEFNDDVKLSGTLKADFLQAVNTEVAINSLLRASQGIKVGAGANEIRVNAGNLEFSNDGVLYKKFGTGTGGGSTGVNLLANDSFEDGISTGWTSSGGTFSQQTYTNGVEGDLKYASFVASTSGQYVETTAVAIPTSFSGGCQADFKKVNVATAGLFKIQAMDTTGATVYAEQTIGVSSWIKVPTISFPCPTSGTMVKLRLISLVAGTIDFDRGYIGSNQNLVNVSSPKYLGQAIWNTTASCVWSSSNASWSSFTPNVACPNPTLSSGSLQAPATKIPGIVIPNFQKGTYYLLASGDFTTSTAGGLNGLRFSAGGVGVSASGILGSGGNGNVTNIPQFSGYIRNGTNQSNVTIDIQAYTISSGVAGIDVSGSSKLLSIEVYFFPDDAEVAVSNEQSSWFIDANIGGSNPVLGVSALNSYTTIGDNSLDLVINSTKGSASAEIPCTSGVASSGANCGGSSEHVGIVFTPPSAGLYEACFIFGHNYIVSPNTSIASTFQIIETGNTAVAIISEGGERVASGTVNNTAAAIANTNPVSVCGTFNFSNTSKRTLRLVYEQIISGTPSSNILLGDRNTGAGQQDIKVIVRPLLSAYNRPILTGNQLSVPGLPSNTNAETISWCFGGSDCSTNCTTGNCFTSQIGTGLVSQTWSALGGYTFNFAKTYSKILCTGSSNVSGGEVTIPSSMRCIGSCSSINVTTYSRSTGAGTNSHGNISCQVQQ